jgi:hypothetical protein
MLTALMRSRRQAGVWLLLLAATVASTIVFELGDGRFWATVVLLVIAAAKILLIMGDYIELRLAPYPLALVCAAWVVAVVAALVVGFAAA